MTKPLTIEQIEAAFVIAAERVRQPRQVYKIERMMGNDVLLTFENRYCLCIKDADIDARVAEIEHERNKGCLSGTHQNEMR